MTTKILRPSFARYFNLSGFRAKAPRWCRIDDNRISAAGVWRKDSSGKTIYSIEGKLIAP